jgi:peroxiredoxin
MLSLLAFALLLPGDVPAARPGAGEPAPSFSAPSTAGGDASLDALKGKKTVVLAFFPKAFTAG